LADLPQTWIEELERNHGLNLSGLNFIEKTCFPGKAGFPSYVKRKDKELFSSGQLHC